MVLKKWIISLTLLISLSTYIKAEINTHMELIHVVERSRVLSMRIIKAHGLISIHNRFRNPSEELERSYTALKTNLIEMQSYLQSHASEVDPQLIPLIQNAQKHFAKLEKEDLLHNLQAERAIDFFLALEKCRVQINKAAEILTKDNSKRDPIFFTTRISTIAQKMGAVYLYKTWGIELPKLDKHFAVMTRKSKKSIAALNKYTQRLGSKLSPEEKEEAKKSITTMQKQLQFFIMSQELKHFIPSLLYSKANTIEAESLKIEKLFK